MRSEPSKRPLAMLSLDLDNEWCYMKTHGNPGWESFPSYLDMVVPRFLSLFDRLGVKVTVFVVGQDAALDKNQSALKSLALAGHEIGNHSFAHEPWLHLYTGDEIQREIVNAEECIEKATGVHPIGFRGPGYAISGQVLRILTKKGYLYDASTLPSFIGPLGRAYYFMTVRLDRDQREKRKILFGSFKDGLRPNKPYLWQIDESTLIEIPVTTFPGLRIPFHVSYLIYLSKFSPSIARAYFRSALRLCQLTGTEPSILVHPLDLLGKDDISTLGFFPGMDLESQSKLDLVNEFLLALIREFDVCPMGVYARDLRERRTLAIRSIPV